MFGLRSARGRAILAGMVFVLLLVSTAALAVWRTNDMQQRHREMDHTSAAATALEGAQGQFWLAQAALSALVISGDVAWVEDYDNALVTAGQDLAKARAEFLAMGEADKVAALDDLTGRIEEFNQTVRWLFQTIIEADRQSVIDLASSSMSQMTATNRATIADLEEMVQEAQLQASTELEAADNAADFTLWLLLGLSGVALATGIGAVVMLVGSVVGPLAALRASARAITSGCPEARAKVSGPEEVASLARDFNDMTDALAAKALALQESEKRYRLLADNASDIIWTMDMNLRLAYESPSVARIRGYSPEEAKAQTMEETLTPASREVAAKVLAEELAIEQAEEKSLSRSRTLELEHTCKDGSTVWLEVTTTFLRDEDGRAVGLLGASRDISERKRAEDALRESEEKYRELVENINEIIYSVDSNGVITYISPVVEQIGGYTPSEVIGRPFTEFVHPDDISPLMRSFQETVAGNREAFEYRVLTKSGETHWVRTSSRPVLEGDRIVGFHAVLTDITERKRAEEAVLRAKEEWERTFDAVPDLIAVIDEHYHIVRANRAMAERLGLTPDECVGKVCYEVVHGLDCPPEFCPHTPSLADGRDHTAEVNEPRLGGEFIVSVTPLADEHGRRVGSVHVARDITERKRAEEALRESEERFRRLTDASLEGIAINDQGEIVDANTAFARMFGHEPSELIGMHASDLVAPGSRELVMQRALSGDEQPYEAVGLRKNGSTFWIEVCGKALPYSGRLLRVTAVRDISERKRAEEALRESEARYKALFAGAPEGMLVADLQTRQFRYANPAMCRMFGYTEEEFLRIGVADIHPKESLDHVLAEFEAQARGEKLLSPGLPCLRKDGTSFYANISAITTVLDGRKCNVGVFSDVTEHKRAEQELRETRDYLEKLIDHANAPIIVWDPSFTITRFNDASERLTGRPANQVIGQRLEVLFPEHERAASMEQIARTLRGEFWELIEIPILHQSGEVRQVLWNSANITGADGRTVVATIAQGTDISERKRAEEERQRLHAELEVRAITDGLTGLYDHAHFYERLSEETERSQRYNHGFAVVMMDVDNFKKFNDSHGHQAGDEMLRLVADSIRSGLRRSDLAFRYGGDEFAAIMLHADAARARTVIGRINRRLAKSLKQMNDGAADGLTLSAGVACFGDHGTTADELVRVADAALYSAKWAAQTRHVADGEYAIESLAPPPAMAASGMLSTTAGSLAAALRELGVPDVMAEMNLRTIAALGTLAKLKDPYISGHQERTSDWAAILAEEMGLAPDRVRDIRLASLLHDLGKAGVSGRILRKPGKLTEEEFAEIKEHPPLGSMMITSEVEALQQLVPIVRHHHERFDGKGYPDGLAGEEIPLEARILAVVDAFDAMTHERSYRKALGREHSLAELRRGAGTQFDPAVVEVFLAWAAKEGEEPPARGQPASEDEDPAAVPTTTT